VEEDYPGTTGISRGCVRDFHSSGVGGSAGGRWGSILRGCGGCSLPRLLWLWSTNALVDNYPSISTTSEEQKNKATTVE